LTLRNSPEDFWLSLDEAVEVVGKLTSMLLAPWERECDRDPEFKAIPRSAVFRGLATITFSTLPFAFAPGFLCFPVGFDIGPVLVALPESSARLTTLPFGMPKRFSLPVRLAIDAPDRIEQSPTDDLSGESVTFIEH
jgi:hypothetical protein